MRKPFSFFISVCAAVLVVFFMAGNSFSEPPGKNTFRNEQKKIVRVKIAYDVKWEGIKKRLHELYVDTSAFSIFIRGFKQEKQLEVWVKSAGNATYQLFATYPVCASSGVPGPKRCQGDYQVPEGFYHVYTFNPYSNFLLSLGVSYPNASDRFFACNGDPGGAIMIHGNCVTIGCIPITDDKIRELYVMAVEARSDGQQEIPIHLFPARMTDENITALEKIYTDKATQSFWDNLKEGYDRFEKTKLVPVVTIDKKGKYIFK